MYVVAVDDELPALNNLVHAIREVVPDAVLNSFQNAGEALDFARNNPVDVAFLDIRMARMDGLALAEELEEIHPKINIIFESGYPEYTNDAMALHASGFIHKPTSAAAVARELDFLRHEPISEDKRVRIQCFGNFGVFVDGVPLMFTQAKPKELLAYLVHQKGATVSTNELIAVLWENQEQDRSLRSQLHNAISRLSKTLAHVGAEDIVIKEWNSMALDVSKVSCDYYDYLKNRRRFAGAFSGEYMANYSWGENTLAFLLMQSHKR